MRREPARPAAQRRKPNQNRAVTVPLDPGPDEIPTSSPAVGAPRPPRFRETLVAALAAERGSTVP